METLHANASGRTRKETLHGRTYWVVPTTIIVPGVLTGSEGAYFYPPDECGKEPIIWNGMPLVVDHPVTKDRKPVSARDPVILEERNVGHFYRARFGDTLQGESWFDEELTRKADARLSHNNKILPRLMRGEAIEQSTGLFLDAVPVANGSKPVDHKGVTYTHTVRNFRADHIAVLPDGVGACSLKDGCGIGVVNRDFSQGSDEAKFEYCPYCGTRQEIDPDSHVCNHCGKEIKCGTDRPMENNSMKKPELIAWLTANCDCWKDKDDAKTLETMSEDKLTKLKGTAEATAVLAANAAKNIVPAPPVAIPVPAPIPIPAINSVTPPVAANMAEWLKTMPADAQAVWNVAIQVEQRERASLVERIVSNQAGSSNEPGKAVLRPIYSAMPIGQLQAIVAAMPAPTVNAQVPGHYDPSNPLASFLPSYIGNGAVVNTGADYDDDDILPLPMATNAKTKTA